VRIRQLETNLFLSLWLDSQKTSSSNGQSSDCVFSFKMGGDEDTTTTTTPSSESHQNSNNGSSNNNTTDLKRYLKNFMLFSNLEIESEKKCRDEQLSKIVKALLYFEAKLRKEQEVIQQQLCEKDRLINQQMHTITDMKVKYGETCDDDDDVNGSIAGINDESNLHATAKYCPMCRKKYYLKATKNIGTQCDNNNKLANKFSTNISDGKFQDFSSSTLKRSHFVVHVVCR